MSDLVFSSNQRLYLLSADVTPAKIDELESCLPEAAKWLIKQPLKEDVMKELVRVSAEVRALKNSLRKILKIKHADEDHLACARTWLVSEDTKISLELNREITVADYAGPKAFSRTMRATKKRRSLREHSHLVLEATLDCICEAELICTGAINSFNNNPNKNLGLSSVIALIEKTLERKLKEGNKNDETIVSQFYHALGNESAGSSTIKNYKKSRANRLAEAKSRSVPILMKQR